MSGVSFAGVWYPGAKGEPQCRSDGTNISATDIHKIAAGMVGAPVTYEHAGVAAAADVPDPASEAIGPGTRSALHNIGRDTFYKTGNASAMAMEPIGVVTGAWVDSAGAGHCTGRIKNDYPGAAGLVRDKKLHGLSLSHFDGETNAVEVTLTSDPARPGCHVATSDVLELPAYMRKHRGGAKQKGAPSTMASPDLTTDAAMADLTVPAPVPPVTQSPLAAILAKMSPEDRNVLQARFEEMDSVAVTATARAKTLESSATDAEILRDQIKQVTDQLSEAERRQYNLGLEAISEQMMSSNPDRVRRGADRLLMACSRKMMMQQHQPEEMGSKRARVEEPAPVQQSFAPPPVAAAAAAPAMSDVLRRALAETYEAVPVE